MTNQVFPYEFYSELTLINTSTELLKIDDLKERKVERI